MEQILSIKDLKKYFVIGQDGLIKKKPVTVKAVDRISFTVDAGETFGLVGESGSGKSTVAYTIAGMYQPTEGSIHFHGVDLFKKRQTRDPKFRKEIQLVFQDPGSSLNPKQNIRQILDLPLRLHRPPSHLTAPGSMPRSAFTICSCE